MPFLQARIAGLEAWFVRRTGFLRHARAPLLAGVLVPLLFGLVSVALGQDTNWDLRNYHWYNPYALLHGRLAQDMAPGNWQSYFNPAIDVPYYLLNQVLPGPLVGFVMGFVHGLNFVLLLAIVRRMLPKDSADWRLCLLLALAGICGGGFLSELGNTMGDNLTALFVLGALYLILRHWERLQTWSAGNLAILLLAGFVMGLGAGLKLTNATYALALCCAMLVVPGSWRTGLASAFTIGCGVIAGVALGAGPWWWRLWQAFGNPLFPQFNNIFKSPLARQGGVLDDFHLPRHVGEALLWPFVFTRDMTRVSELAFTQAILPVLYALAWLFVARWVFERWAGGRAGRAPAAPLSARARFLLVFGLVAYLAWLRLFSLYRYLIPLELLAPLMAWLLIGRLFGSKGSPGRAAANHAARIAGWTIALTTLVVFPFKTWGHAGWGERPFSAQLPAFADPASTVVITAHGHPPMGWLTTLMPPAVRVVSIASGFPETPAYVAKMQGIVAGRPGPHYVMLSAGFDEKESSRLRKLALVDALGLTASSEGCARLDKLLRRVRFQVEVQAPGPAGRACTLALQPQYRVDLPAQARATAQDARDRLAAYGLAVDTAACKRYEARAGADAYPVQFCPVKAAFTSK
jgi:hypothetical protein